MKAFKILALMVAMVFASPVHAAFNHNPELKAFESELAASQFLHMAERADQALDMMFQLATSRMQERGYSEEAEQLALEWQFEWHGYLPMALALEGMGDHAPMSAWLTVWYDKIESMLGETAMQLLHLDDIQTINYGLPVIFNLKILNGDVIDLPEYALHFNPFCGVLAYWGVFIACEVVTTGVAAFLVCSPAGAVAEFVMVTYISPKFVGKSYQYFYP